MKRTTRIFPTTAFFVPLSIVLIASSGHAENAADSFRAKMEKWVEARTLLSKERAEWIVDRQDLETTRDLLRRERDALRDEVKVLEESSVGADQERRELLLLRGDYQRLSAALVGQVAQLEEQVMELAPRLPEPLQKRLEPLLVQIPTDPENTRAPLGQRMMNVLGVLAQAEKWNNTATFVGETRAVRRDQQGGQKVQVRTLYWGLGQAMYVDAQGETAGVGRPGDSGWVFEDDSELADRAKLLLDIYEGNVDTIAFVAMPVELQ